MIPDVVAVLQLGDMLSEQNTSVLYHSLYTILVSNWDLHLSHWALCTCDHSCLPPSALLNT